MSSGPTKKRLLQTLISFKSPESPRCNTDKRNFQKDNSSATDNVMLVPKKPKKMNSVTDLRESVKDHGLVVDNVPGDGNCLFEAVSRQLNHLDGQHRSRQEVKTEILNYIRAHPTSVIGEFNVNDAVRDAYGSLDNYISHMTKEGAYGDGTILAMIPFVYQRNVLVYYCDRVISLSDDHLFNCPSICLGFVNDDHYVSLLLSNDVLLKNRATSSSVDVEATSDSLRMCNASVTALPSNELPNYCASTKTKADNKESIRIQKIVDKRKVVFTWLMPVEGGALCELCSKFYRDRPLPMNHSDVFVTTPFGNWSKSTGSTTKNNKLLKHHKSASHLAATAFHKDGENLSLKKRTVYSMVHRQSDEEKEFQLERLTDFVDAAYYLFKNEIAHTTNFESLISLISRLDGSQQIEKFRNCSPLNAKYDSKITVTELLTAVSEWLTNDIFNRARKSKFISILADESTDIRTRNELSVCFRFVENGDAIETFLCLRHVESTKADSIKDAIKKILLDAKIPLDRVFWMAFDGASNMSGRINGVQAKLKSELLINAHYIHCRSHVLNLAAANVANGVNPLLKIFSAFNSLWKFFHNSPLRHNKLVQVRSILNDSVLELVRVGDTRWTSNYRAVRAVRSSLESVVITLQKIHSSSGDLSSEAGGLLLTFQDQTSILLIHAIEEILQPINILTLTLQSTKLSLAGLPEKVDLAILRLRQIAEDSSTYSNGFNQFLSEAKFPTIGTAANIEEVHSKIVQPYIQTLCRNVEKRFGDAAGKIGIAATIFKPSNVNTQDIDQQQEHVRALAKYFCLHEEEAVTEWVCFRNYLMKHQNDTTDQILKSMLTSDVGDSYPQIYQLAGIVLSCPIGTAGVERSFSTMNRVCNRLRQRLSVQHMHELMLISQEGPEKISRGQLKDIVYTWYSQGPRRIQLPVL